MISIVSPSYNQAKYLEYCLESICRQRDAGSVEHLVLDGGSTDESRKMLEKWTDRLDYWRSRRDKGQSDAINEGMRRARGQILTWINSDDALADGAAATMASVLGSVEGPAWVIGGCLIINAENQIVDSWMPTRHDELAFMVRWSKHYVMQPAVFWNRAMWDTAGPLEEHLHYAMDFDLWLRFFRVRKPILIQAPIGVHRFHGESKTSLVSSQIFDDYLWAVDRRLGADDPIARAARRDIARSLARRASAEVFHGRRPCAWQMLRKAIDVDWRVIGDSVFLKPTIKYLFRFGSVGA